MKKLSIITICLNNCNGLQKTIRSVDTQTFRDFELIIIDGGSSDGSLEVIAENKQRISRWISEKDNGIFHAQNKGLGFAGGEYCLFLNAGDYLVGPDVLDKVFMNTARTDILYGNMIIESSAGKIRMGQMPVVLTFHHMIADTLWHPVSFIRRDLFAKYGNYDESFKMVADYDFFLRTVIVGQASTTHLGFTIAVFKLDGFSSDPRNAALRDEERTRVQRKYFPVKVIESAKAYNRLIQSRWYKLAKLLRLV